MLPSARTAFCVCIVPLLGQAFLCATDFSRARQGSGMCAIAHARTLEGTLLVASGDFIMLTNFYTNVGVDHMMTNHINLQY